MNTSPTGKPASHVHRVPVPLQPVDEVSRLIGRAAELEAVHAVVDGTGSGGGALVLRGDTGVGKSALLAAAARRAHTRGAGVLVVRGDAARADVAFDALARLLRPVWDGPPHPRRQALRTILGLGGESPSDWLRVAAATLAALRDAGRGRALLLVVDDMQDLDEATAQTLAVVARRLPGTGVGLLAATGSGADQAAGPAGIPQLKIGPLNAADAAELVRECVPHLPEYLVHRVVGEADGNPSALRELAAPLARADRAAAPWAPVLQPDPYLVEPFAPRIQGLPAGARSALLVAALSQGIPGPGAALLDPATRAGLVEIDDDTGAVRFRHPLVRAAVHHLATPGERRAAHRTIARLLTGRPTDQITHLAAATADPHDRLAQLVQRTAWRALRSGDAAAATALLVRAAQLSRSGGLRARRLAAAASVVAHDTGDLGCARRLLDTARRTDPGHCSPSAAVAEAYGLLHHEGNLPAAYRRLVAALAGEPNDGRPARAVLDGLHLLVDAAASGGSPDVWASVTPIVGLRSGDRSSQLRLRAGVLADPSRVSRRQAAALDDAVRTLSAERDPTRITRVAALALDLDRVAECREPLRRVLDAGRAGRAVPAAMTSFVLLCAGGIASGRWLEAGALAEEGIALCERHGHRLMAMRLQLGPALIAAARGDEVGTRALVDPVLAWAGPRDIRSVVHEAHRVLALAALGRGDAEDAYRHATSVTRPGRLKASGPWAMRVSMDLVDAAVRIGRWDEANRHVQAMHDAPVRAVSARFAMQTAVAAALVAAPDDADELFDEALAAPGADRWPFDQARIQLAYGEHLRRRRHADRSRVFLGAALDTFLRLEADPWAARARHGLRATGLTTGRPDRPDPAAALTSDQRAVAALAAAGLTNKQIARQLTVSHHTVAARLYQAFPKLGVGSRAALRDAMRALDGEMGRTEGAALDGIA